MLVFASNLSFGDISSLRSRMSSSSPCINCFATILIIRYDLHKQQLVGKRSGSHKTHETAQHEFQEQLKAHQ